MSAKKMRVIVYKDGDAWIAQGLEHDICVQAATLDDLYGRFEVAMRLEDDESGGLQRVPEAPRHYFDLWERRSGNFLPKNLTNSSYEVGMAA